MAHPIKNYRIEELQWQQDGHAAFHLHKKYIYIYIYTCVCTYICKHLDKQNVLSSVQSCCILWCSCKWWHGITNSCEICLFHWLCHSAFLSEGGMDLYHGFMILSTIHLFLYVMFHPTMHTFLLASVHFSTFSKGNSLYIYIYINMQIYIYIYIYILIIYIIYIYVGSTHICKYICFYIFYIYIA